MESNTKVCPACAAPDKVGTDGVVTHHQQSNGKPCPASGQKAGVYKIIVQTHRLRILRNRTTPKRVSRPSQ